MCARFTLTRSAAEVAEHFGLAVEPAHAPRFNIAPGQWALAVRKAPHGQREVASLRWGLVPFWARDDRDAGRHINARIETLGERPAFREAAAERRCLVPADGFYEWRGARGEREPFHVALPNAALFAMAGVWERWRTADGKALESFAIVTTAAGPNIRPLHPRMPVLVDPDGYAAWLDSEERDVAHVLESLPGSRGAALVAHRVSVRVNDVRHDDAGCLAPAEQGALFRA